MAQAKAKFWVTLVGGSWVILGDVFFVIFYVASKVIIKWVLFWRNGCSITSFLTTLIQVWKRQTMTEGKAYTHTHTWWEFILKIISNTNQSIYCALFPWRDGYRLFIHRANGMSGLPRSKEVGSFSPVWVAHISSLDNSEFCRCPNTDYEKQTVYKLCIL